MRIALCVSGQPRVVRGTFDKYIKRNLFDINSDHQIDTFVHTWFDNEDAAKPYMNAGGHPASEPVPSTVIQDIQELYDPVKMLVEKQVMFDEKDYNEHKMPSIIPFFSLSKMASIQRADALRIAYQNEQNNQQLYDGVISFRFDLALDAPFKFEEAFTLDSSEMKLHNPVGCPHPNSVTTPMTWTCNLDVMLLYVNLIDHIDELYYDDNVIFCDEPLAGALMEKHNIEYPKYKIPLHLARN